MTKKMFQNHSKRLLCLVSHKTMAQKNKKGGRNWSHATKRNFLLMEQT